MITQSGCFGTKAYNPPIDDLEEAAQAVEEIIGSDHETVPSEPSQESAPDLEAAQLLVQYMRRVRLLTWAVVAIAAYLVLKEMK
jgi:hypothetical protein